MEVKAWHFTGNSLRDGSPIPPVGETLKWGGELIMCRSGLHASERIMDALQYAPANLIHRVECGGDTIQGHDKLVCRERTILWSVDGEDLLRGFARWCALEVIDLWDVPDIVREYLEIGNEDLRDAAWAAAGAAAGDVMRDKQNAKLEEMVRECRTRQDQ